MARQSSWGELVSAGSNLYQNKQLADQSRALQAQNEMMEQQLLMQQMERLQKAMIVEKRKMLMQLHGLLDKADMTARTHPEYAWTMMSIVGEEIQGSGLQASDFEEVADMEKANQINTRLHDTISTIHHSMAGEQREHASKMKSVIVKEEDEIERLTYLHQLRERWGENKPRFDEIDPIHRENKKRATIFFAITLSISVIALGAGMAALGECVEFDADDICETYENDGSIGASIGIGLGALMLVVAVIGGIPFGLKANKYRSEWNDLDEIKSASEDSEGERNMLSNTYHVHTSTDSSELRRDLMSWVDGLTPADPSMRLGL